MPQNVEVKAWVRDWQRAREIASAISDQPVQILHQTDTFFKHTEGRLKLRDFGDGHGELIWYARDDRTGTKTSLYRITNTSDPVGLNEVLRLSYGIRCVVEKTRELYLVGQTRIHLDQVVGLGNFLELEYVLNEGESPTSADTTVMRLLEKLQVVPEDHIAVAYADLLVG